MPRYANKPILKTMMVLLGLVKIRIEGSEDAEGTKALF